MFPRLSFKRQSAKELAAKAEEDTLRAQLLAGDAATLQALASSAEPGAAAQPASAAAAAAAEAKRTCAPAGPSALEQALAARSEQERPRMKLI